MSLHSSERDALTRIWKAPPPSLTGLFIKSMLSSCGGIGRWDLG